MVSHNTLRIDKTRVDILHGAIYIEHCNVNNNNIYEYINRFRGKILLYLYNIYANNTIKNSWLWLFE